MTTTIWKTLGAKSLISGLANIKFVSTCSIIQPQ